MGLYFCDASALVKYYVAEPGSSSVRQIVDDTDSATGHTLHTIFIAAITQVEVAAALAIIERIGRIQRRERDRMYRRFTSDLVHRHAIVPITASDLTLAAELTQSYPLKAYDAVQLAVAIGHDAALRNHGLSLTFLSHDRSQLSAAQAKGLRTLDPVNPPASL